MRTIPRTGFYHVTDRRHFPYCVGRLVFRCPIATF